jgi:hypothetical protein
VYLRVNFKTPTFVRACRTSVRGLRARPTWPSTPPHLCSHLACTKHKYDICRLVQYYTSPPHSLVRVFFFVHSLSLQPATCKSTYQKTNLKFIYICLFVMYLLCSTKHERQTITAPIIYNTCDLKKTFALLSPEHGL